MLRELGTLTAVLVLALRPIPIQALIVEQPQRSEKAVAATTEGIPRYERPHIYDELPPSSVAREREIPYNGFDRVPVNDHAVALFNAACLDGTPPVFYRRSARNSQSRRFVIFIPGGGWCGPQLDHPHGPGISPDQDHSVNFEPCVWRAESCDGSARFTDTRPVGRWALASGDPAINPHFHGDHHVQLAYCDGSSFTSGREEPQEHMGQRLHMRGRANLQAIFYMLAEHHGLRDATEIVLAGSSAGALAVLLNIDFLSEELLPGLGVHARIVGLADSGFFLNAAHMKTGDMWENKLRGADELWGSTISGNTNKACLAAYPHAPWRCLMAQYVTPFVRAPLFVANSAADVWQVAEILGVRCLPGIAPPATPLGPRSVSADHLIREYQPPWGGWAETNPCAGEDAVPAVDEFVDSFEVAFKAAVDRPGNGFFLDHCLWHGHSGSVWTSVLANPSQLSVGHAFANWYFNTSDNEGSRVWDSHSWNAWTRVNPTCPGYS